MRRIYYVIAQVRIFDGLTPQEWGPFYEADAAEKLVIAMGSRSDVVSAKIEFRNLPIQDHVEFYNRVMGM